MKFKLLEAKSVGTIYHFTSVQRMIAILMSNSMKANSNMTYISFTRDPELKKDGRKPNKQQPHIDFWSNTRITIDGNALSNNYKTEPYNWYFDAFKQTDSHRNDEMEERVIKNEILNIKKYILQRVMDDETGWDAHSIKEKLIDSYEASDFRMPRVNIVSKFTNLNQQDRYIIDEV